MLDGKHTPVHHVRGSDDVGAYIKSSHHLTYLEKKKKKKTENQTSLGVCHCHLGQPVSTNVILKAAILMKNSTVTMTGVSAKTQVTGKNQTRKLLPQQLHRTNYRAINSISPAATCILYYTYNNMGE